MSSLFSDLISEDGSYQFEREQPPIDPGVERWLPAYFADEEGEERVVDPTGGGNGFLGGMAIALARGKGVVEAAAWGSVAASFCIEQVGVPILGKDDEGRETWNGERVEGRLEKFMGRIGLGEVVVVEKVLGRFDKMDVV